MIYLDHHATTPCDARVVQAMLPYFSTHFGNASSTHALGETAFEAVETARHQVADLIKADAAEIIWTSGATEANNLAILGLARGVYAQRLPFRCRIVTSAIEHKSVLAPLRVLERVLDNAFEIVVLPVERDGTVCIDAACRAIDEQTLLVSIQAANGEIGTIQPLKAISDLTRKAGALLHCDAAQAVGKIPLDVDDIGIDVLSLSGHKIYAPKGVGALYIRRGVASQMTALQWGGEQEKSLRAGTLPVPLIVGLGEACRIARAEMTDEAQRLSALRDEFEARLQESWPTVLINGAKHNRLPHSRLPHNSSLTFPDLPVDVLLSRLPDLAFSTGAACDAGALEPSKPLTAIGLSRADASSTIRVGLGRLTTRDEIVSAVSQIAQACHSLQKILPT